MRSSANGVAGDRTGTSNGSSSVDKGVDFANYFCTYALLYHQKEMLCDRVRMEAYYNAVFENKHHFHGKTVLDVGTGSGILAIWAGQAGARKVYAVEATKMSEHARELVKANNLEDVVEVIEGSMEDVTLPEKVDVIISEWMGYFLLRESMFDSVICARDRWLKPTGVMYPSNARMWLAPIRSGLANQKMSDYEGSMDDWFYFLDQTKTYYGVDMSVLTKPFAEEQKKYYLQTSLWNNLHPNQVIGTAAIIKDIDCLTATVNDILNLRASILSSISSEETRLCGFAGWFDVHFRGSKENPAQQEIELTTAPSEDYSTHWGQQVFLLHPPISVSEGDDLNINFSMDRQKQTTGHPITIQIIITILLPNDPCEEKKTQITIATAMASLLLIQSPTLLSHPSPQSSSSSLPLTLFHHRKIQTHHRPKRNNHLVPQSAVGEISVSYSPPPQESNPELKLKLLSAVSGLNRGLAATEDDIQKADAAAKELEAAGGPVDLSVDLDKLQGRWKLIYSSAFSSRTLGGSRPGPPTGRLLPITLGQVFQRIDIFSKDFDNIVELKLGAPWPLPPIELTATLAHKFELIGSSKIKITFEKTTVKTGGNLSQIPPLEIPRIPDFLRPQSNTGSGEFEVTYMDSDTRITRGDRGELRVFVIS